MVHTGGRARGSEDFEFKASLVYVTELWVGFVFIWGWRFCLFGFLGGFFVCLFFVIVVVVFRVRVSLCSPGCPRTHSVDQDGLTEISMPLLGLKACTTTALLGSD